MEGPTVANERMRPDWRSDPFLSSALVWLILVLFVALVGVFISVIGAGLETDPRAGLFSWQTVLIVGVAGLIGIWFSLRTGFPAALDPRISNRQRFLYPLLIGFAFGLLTIAVEQVTHGIEFFLASTGLPLFNAPFPGSVLFYSGGAIIVEVIYRLLPIPILLWLISSVILRGRAQNQVFLVIAVLISLWEPLSQNQTTLASGQYGLFALLFLSGYAFNLTQALVFRRWGLLAPITLRVGDYLIWHIIYGNLICQC